MDSAEIFALLQILLIDITMAGDNAIAVGLAAAGLPKEQRKRAVMVGIVAATILRILFAVFATQLLKITGLLAAGGLLLLWVAWKMYFEVRHLQRIKKYGSNEKDIAKAESRDAPKKFSSALTQIVLADVSMSLDNILAVAGVARDHLVLLVIGLTLSVFLMGVAASYIAKMTHRYPWIGMIGVVLIAYAAGMMIWDGSQELLKPETLNAVTSLVRGN